MKYLIPAVLLALTPALARATVLYSGQSTPTGEGWTYGTKNPALSIPSPWSGAVETPLSPGVQLSTTSNNAGYAGYFRQLAPGTLDRNAGFQLSFTAALPQEINTGTPRAGLSLIVLTSDSRGIELAFQSNQIFAQNGTFTGFGESVAFNPAPLTTYHLAIQGNAYTLSTDATPLLTGFLRTYTPSPSAFAFVYAGQDGLFLGDDTSEASAVFQVQSVAVVPEPTALGLLGTTLPFILRRSRK